MTSRTYEQFTALGLDACHTPPFTFEYREPRDTNPTGNYYASRGVFEDDLLGIVVHITAGLEDFYGSDNSAESTDNWGKGTSTASWPGIVDSDSIINSLHPKRVAFLHGVPGYNFNRALYGLEISKRNPDWRNTPQAWTDATLKNAAAYCAPIVLKHRIPLVVMTDRDEIQRKIDRREKVGFTEHWRLTPETRSDAGRIGSSTTFPWDRFFTFLRRQMALITGKTEGAPALPPATNLTIRRGTVLAVTANALNVRVGPGTNFEAVGAVPKGTKFYATGATKNGWVEGRTPFQRKNKLPAHWVNSAWLRVVSQPKAATSVPKTTASYPVLSLGSKGTLVARLQRFAMTAFPAYAGSIRNTGGADGSFGFGTEDWVQEFQRRSGLVPDGYVGPKTWLELGKYGFKP